ncbi:MAG: DegV family protein [Defluviitaleaceae bacterium]|nr:DegV family protein [Defluviitaleaceae bacterium]
MGIKIVTDSTTEITQAEAKKLGIIVVPLKSLFGDAEYLDGVDLTPEEFYEKLAESKVLPTTSQPSPHDFEKAFREAQEDGDQIITICIADKISGTGQSARIAKEICGGDIWVIDSETATLAVQILVKRALQLIKTGKTAQEIVDIIEEEKTSVCLYAVVDTLEYLLKGGRLSRTSAIAGAVLNIKPIVSVSQGGITTVGKCMGIKKAYKEIFRLVEASGGIDFSKPFAIGYTGDRDRFNDFEVICKEQFKGNEPIIGSIGAVIGTHAGPGAVAITYFKK